MGITGINQYAARMTKLENVSGFDTHIIWRDCMNNLDENALIAKYTAAHPSASAQDNYVIVQWISTPDQPTAPVN
jgi:hypothetical protein